MPKVDLSVIIPSRKLLFFKMFSIISFCCFVCFLEPVFSLWSLHTKFMSYRITYWTTAIFFSVFSVPISIIRKFVTMLAVCFSKVYGRWSITSEDIDSLSNKFKVIWITAGRIITFMINLCKSSIINSSWNRFFKVCIEKSMHPFSSTSKMSHWIFLIIKRTKPVPASCFRINEHLGDHAVPFFVSEPDLKFINFLHDFLYHNMRGLSIWEK